jgi:hypothetical protein
MAGARQSVARAPSGHDEKLTSGGSMDDAKVFYPLAAR